jgi:hypothetical protein
MSDTTEKSTEEMETVEPSSDTEEELSDTEEEGDDELVFDFPNMTLKKDTGIYVVTMDGIPRFYSKTLVDARARMWDCARVRNYQVNRLYHTYIREGSDPNRIQIIGSYWFFIIAYESLLSSLSVRYISEIEETPATEDTISIPTSTSSSGWLSFLG